MTPKAFLTLQRTKQEGMSFIEVLIALFVLVTGILGAVAMQATAKKGALDALQRSVASALTQDILVRMRSNDIDELNNYANTYEAVEPSAIIACFSSSTLCTSAELRVEDTLQWQHGLSGLIDGVGCIAVNNNQVTITISWQGRVSTQDGATSDNGVDCGTANSNRRQVVLHAFVI
jgi:type IV pilus assembly protein PilV